MGSCNCVETKKSKSQNDINNLANELDADDKRRNSEIGEYMKKEQQKETKIKKILLLGAGSSGKSTLFKQIDDIHGNGKSKGLPHQNLPYIAKQIRINCIDSMIKLLRKSHVLSEKYGECKVDFEEKEIENAINILVPYSKFSKTKSEPKFNDKELCNKISASIEFLWSLDGIQATYKLRQYFSLTENIDYFFNKIMEIMVMDYRPTNEDVIKCRMKTTGIVEQHYEINNHRMHIFDVGGQRNERKKWIQLFDGVDVIIFVAALNHYCCVLFEDENVNCMMESMDLFDEVINSKWFRMSQMVLFLNKEDIFQNRLMEGISLSVCFGDDYDGPNYNEPGDDRKLTTEQEQNEWLDYCYMEAIKFITKQYRARNQRKRLNNNKVYVHVTNATSKDNVEKVFKDVRHGLIQNSLIGSGLIDN